MGRNTCFIVYKPVDIVRKASQNDTYIKLYFCTMSPKKTTQTGGLFYLFLSYAPGATPYCALKARLK